jgi:hypothetical protein
MLAQHAVGLGRALAEGGVDRLKPLGERDKLSTPSGSSDANRPPQSANT